MKSSRFTNRHWLGAILTLSITVLLGPANICADSPSEKADLNSVAGPRIDASSDPYWKYYDDCDRWGIEFGQLNPARTSQLRWEKQESGPGPSSRLRKTSPFQTVKHVMPKRTGANKKTAGQPKSNFAQFKSSLFQVQMVASRTFQQHVLPSIQFMEFVSVESASFPEYFLQPRQTSVQQRLGLIWRQAIIKTGLDQLADTWIAKQNTIIQTGKSVGKKIGYLLQRVLQKSTGRLWSAWPTLNN